MISPSRTDSSTYDKESAPRETNESSGAMPSRPSSPAYKRTDVPDASPARRGVRLTRGGELAGRAAVGLAGPEVGDLAAGRG